MGKSECDQLISRKEYRCLSGESRTGLLEHLCSFMPLSRNGDLRCWALLIISSVFIIDMFLAMTSIHNHKTASACLLAVPSSTEIFESL
jgi:hypothetical protein